MNKYTLGTIVGTALLGLAKAKSGNALKLSRGVVYSIIAYKDFYLRDYIYLRLGNDPLFYSEYEANVVEPASKELEKFLLKHKEEFKRKYALSRLPQLNLNLEEVPEYHDDDTSGYRITLSLEIEYMVTPDAKSPLERNLLEADNNRELGPILMNDRKLKNERHGLIHLIDDELETHIFSRYLFDYGQAPETTDTIHHRFALYTLDKENKWVPYEKLQPNMPKLRVR